MKRTLTIALCLALALPALAQKPQPDNWEKRIQSEKIAFLTAELDLSPEEAQAFWPVYNQYWKDCGDAHKNTGKCLMILSNRKGETLTEAQMTQYADDYVKSLGAEQALLQKYYPEFKKVLPIEKVCKLFCAEEHFRMKMIHGLRGHGPGKDNGRGPGR